MKGKRNKIIDTKKKKKVITETKNEEKDKSKEKKKENRTRVRPSRDANMAEKKQLRKERKKWRTSRFDCWLIAVFGKTRL